MTPAAKRTATKAKAADAQAPAEQATTEEDRDAVEARGAAYRAVASRRFHLEGCPVESTDDDYELGIRLEMYEQRRPPVVDSNGAVTEPAKLVTVLHCVACGDTYVYDERMAELIGQEVTA